MSFDKAIEHGKEKRKQYTILILNYPIQTIGIMIFVEPVEIIDFINLIENY